MAVTVHYSHAAPHLREKFVDAVRNANAARTQRDRKAGFAAAFAYYTALRIVATAGDTTQAVSEAVGLPDSMHFDRGDAEQVKAFLGENEYEIFAAGAGLTETTTAPARAGGTG